ncbi:hypothetical protein SPM24T3_23822 [Serratia sp. M24T3]|nr:hypothetical protein SPM24T3_23822 [Serratia sp. M24T3]
MGIFAGQESWLSFKRSVDLICLATLTLPRTVDILIPRFPCSRLIASFIEPFSDNAAIIKTCTDGVSHYPENC